MARIYAMFLACVLVVSLSTCSTNGLNLLTEDQIRILLQNYEELKEELRAMKAESKTTNEALAVEMKELKAESIKKDSALTAKVRELQTIALHGGRFASEIVASGNNITDRQCCTINKLPTSCQDLKEIGHVLSGFYTVKKDDALQTVYCDFTKATVLQKLIGYHQVKTAPIFFNLRKNAALDWAWELKAMPYEVEQTNIGASIDKATGTFTAPQAGKYYFIATIKATTTADRNNNKINGQSWFYLLKNGTDSDSRIASSFCDELEKDQNCNHVVHAMVVLKKGDKIFTSINGQNTKLYDDSNRYTSFSGWLIEEDMSLKLASV